MEILGVLSSAPISFVVLDSFHICWHSKRLGKLTGTDRRVFREIWTQVMSSAWWSHGLGQNAKGKSLLGQNWLYCYCFEGVCKIWERIHGLGAPSTVGGAGWNSL